MRRVIVVVVAGLSLAGCASFSMDSFRAAPVPVNVDFDSIPPGAEAKTSSGPSCKTPCTLPVPAENFSVTFTLPRFQPATVPVQVMRNPGDLTSAASVIVDPSPVIVELQPAGPPPRKGAAKRRAPPPPRAAAAPPPPPAAEGSPFPPPPQLR